MKKNQPKVYALILNYNSSQDSIALYSNLQQLQYNNIQVLIIDNASSETEMQKLSENIPKANLIFNNRNIWVCGRE